MKTLLLGFLAIIFTISGVFAQSDAQNIIEVNMGFTRNEIQRALDNSQNSTSDDIQLLLFEPEVWKANLAKTLKVSVSDFPADWQAPVREQLEKLRGLINEAGKNNSWKQPPFKRPVEENMAKAKFLTYYKGGSVLNIGSNYKDWNMFKNSLGIPTNRFIRGTALLKIPNRPYCQVQEWIVKQSYAGGRWSASKVDSFGGGGYFVKCP
jgi:hypothetical protein